MTKPSHHEVTDRLEKVRQSLPQGCMILRPEEGLPVHVLVSLSDGLVGCMPAMGCKPSPGFATAEMKESVRTTCGLGAHDVVHILPEPTPGMSDQAWLKGAFARLKTVGDPSTVVRERLVVEGARRPVYWSAIHRDSSLSKPSDASSLLIEEPGDIASAVDAIVDAAPVYGSGDFETGELTPDRRSDRASAVREVALVLTQRGELVDGRRLLDIAALLEPPGKYAGRGQSTEGVPAPSWSLRTKPADHHLPAMVDALLASTRAWLTSAPRIHGLSPEKLEARLGNLAKASPSTVRWVADLGPPDGHPDAFRFALAWDHVRASLGDRESMLRLSHNLAALAAQDADRIALVGGGVTPVELGLLSAAWKRLSTVSLSKGMPSSSRAMVKVGRVAFDIVDGADAAMAAAGCLLEGSAPVPSEPTVIKPKPPEMTVLAGVGDPNGKDGQSIAKRYARLMRPLRLVGGAQPDMVWDALQTEFPWMEKANEAVALSSAVAKATPRGAHRGKPLLLVGPPGVGKTRYARRVAETLGLPFRSLSLSGASTSMSILAVERGWSSGRPSFLADAMMSAETANLLVLADEIDKVATGRNNGNITDAMLSLLEPETARLFHDGYLLAPLDCSAVNWMLTANDASELSDALVSRVRLVETGKPGPEHFDLIVPGVVRDVAGDLGLRPTDLPDVSESMPALKAGFLGHGSIRLFRESYEKAVSERFWTRPDRRPDSTVQVAQAPDAGDAFERDAPSHRGLQGYG